MAPGLRSERGVVAIKAVSCELNADRLNNTCPHIVGPGGLRQRTKTVSRGDEPGQGDIYFSYLLSCFSQIQSWFRSAFQEARQQMRRNNVETEGAKHPLRFLWINFTAVVISCGGVPTRDLQAGWVVSCCSICKVCKVKKVFLTPHNG